MVKFEIRQIDAWAEAEGGWTWNNSIKVGEFQTRAADQKRAFLYASQVGDRVQAWKDGGCL